MNVQLLFDATQAGQDAIAAVKDGRKWTAVRHTGRGLVAVGTFGEDFQNTPATAEGPGDPTDPTMTFERIMADNGNNPLVAADVAIKKCHAIITVESTRATAQPGEQGKLGDGEFAKKHPVIVKLLKTALSALLASLI